MTPRRPADSAVDRSEADGLPLVSRARGSAALVVLVVLAAAACMPRPRVPTEAPPPPAPFERAPYVQDVVDGRAKVLWRTSAPEAASDFRFRVGDGAWRDAPVRRGGGGDRRAELRELPADTTVTYAVEAAGREMGPFRFRTPPADTSTATVDVLVFGDSGWGSPIQLALAGLMEERRWDLAVHVGDVAYPDGSEDDLTQRHFRVYRRLLARVPFFPSPGNHDLHAAGGGGRPYDRAFAWPGQEEGGRFYAFRWGRVGFVSLDTSTDSVMAGLEEREGRQYRWLEAKLAEMAADSTLAWTVVYTHRPLYSRGVGFGRNPPREKLREVLEPLFLEHGVDLVLAGHDHFYQRTRPLRNGRVVDAGCGPVHLIAGGGGASLYGRSVAPGDPAARVVRAHHFVDLALGASGGSGVVVGREGRTLDRFRLVPYDPGDPTCDR